MCVSKNWNMDGYLQNYELYDIWADEIVRVTPNELRQIMLSETSKVLNLKFTPKGTIVDCEPKKIVAKTEKQNNKRGVDAYKAAIDKKVVEDRERVQNKKLKDAQLVEQLIRQIREWQPRIQKILELYTYIATHDSDNWRHYGSVNIGNSKNFGLRTEGIYHRLGAYLKDEKMYIGYAAGGACGNVDFYTDGVKVNYNASKGSEAWGLKRFVANFEAYETAFYNWLNENYKG